MPPIELTVSWDYKWHRKFYSHKMASDQRQFEDVLQEAQAKGYAETDPTFDIEGIDARAGSSNNNEFDCLLNSLQFAETYTEGIKNYSGRHSYE